jgi:TolB protein
MILAEDGQTGELYIFDVASSRVLNVHKELGLQPIYAYWAPDGQHLVFLRNREQTLSLDLWSAFGWQPPKRIADGVPFYFDWRADAKVLLFHSGQSGVDRQAPSTSSAGSSVGLLNVESGTTKTVSQTPAAFGAPSWSFDNKWLAYGDKQQAKSPVLLIVAPADGGEPQAFADVSQRLALAWSPTQSRIAVATTSFLDGSVYEELRLIDIPSGETRTVVKDPFAAYFWSPDGTRILYTRRQPGSPFGTWVVVDVTSGKSTDIIDFTPSRTLIQVFQYFDQYALSHRLWSPDSRHFAFAGRVGSDEHPLAALQSPNVYVVEATPHATPQLLSDGSIAFWSPQ